MSDELRATRERLRPMLQAGSVDVEKLPCDVIEDLLAIAWNDLAEHPADDNQFVELGTLYADDTARIETRIVGVGEIAIAIQSTGTDWNWCVLRTWEHPAAPTRGDVRRLLAALGIEPKEYVYSSGGGFVISDRVNYSPLTPTTYEVLLRTSRLGSDEKQVH